jgi:hypothetical protein
MDASPTPTDLHTSAAASSKDPFFLLLYLYQPQPQPQPQPLLQRPPVLLLLTMDTKVSWTALLLHRNRLYRGLVCDVAVGSSSSSLISDLIHLRRRVGGWGDGP